MGGRGIPSKGGDTMNVEAAITIMILFGTFVLALLTYISDNYKKK
ncbi:hypothetical protein J27TS7_48520 [Paenibacillus dendritiformis]|nr:hypothetical protein J27TS7_48520 [Paenibacillus dendritiformis]